MDPNRTEVDRPKEAGEFNWRSKLYVHFVSLEADADSIVDEKKLRTSTYQGREDRVFAVDLDETLRNDRVQLGKGVGRAWGVLFTTPDADLSNNFRNEVYWFPDQRDEISRYIPLDLVIKLDLKDVRTAIDLLNTISPEWGEPDEERFW